MRAIDRLSDADLHAIVHRMIEDPRVRQRAGFRGWWYRYAGSVAFVTLIAIAAAGFFKVEDTVDRIEAERAARAGSVAGIIQLFCATDNEQDALLAQLVGVSLAGAPPRAKLTEQELQGLRIFNQALRDLQDGLNCKVLVRRFDQGLPVPPP